MIAATKRCNRCGEVKPRESFYFQDADHRKRMSRCKACVSYVTMLRRGKVRKTSYREGRCDPRQRNPKNTCTQCGGKRRGQDKADIGLCATCERYEQVELFGGVAWRNRLMQMSNKSVRQPDDWAVKMDTLVRSIKQRDKAASECEKKRVSIGTPMDWDKRLHKLSQNRSVRDGWTRVMDTKARNWRRKERKVSIHVQGDIKEVTAVVTRTRVQVCFDWADIDA